MTPTLAEFIDAWRAAGGNPKGSRGKWTGLCPAHELDGQKHTPSCDVTAGGKVPVVVKCRSQNCTYPDMVRALGLDRETRETMAGARSGILAEYDYRDESGKLLFQVVRKPPKPDGKKVFSQRTPAPGGGWSWERNGARRVLYRLPELLAADHAGVVYVVEGEKDADRLAGLGLVATTAAEGAKAAWLPGYSDALRGRNVVILPDNDDPGRAHGDKVAAALHGKAASVRLVHLRDVAPDLPEGGDVSDWLNAGGTVEKLRELVAAVGATVAGTTPSIGTIELGQLVTREFPPPRWAIPNLLPEGLTLLVSGPKFGKSFMALEWSLAIVSGGPIMGNANRRAERGDVIYLGLEDGLRRLQSRARAIMRHRDIRPAVPGRGQLHFYDGVKELPTLADGLTDCLAAKLDEHPETRLLVIDTLGRVRGSARRGQDSYSVDTAELGQLQRLALQRGVAILVLHHKRKGGDSDFIEAASGTLGIAGAADAVLYLERARNQADAVLKLTGRDIEEAELALKRETVGTPGNGGIIWTELGDAEDYRHTNERREVIEAIRQMAADGAKCNPPATDFRPADLARFMAREGEQHANTLSKLLRKLRDAGDLTPGKRFGFYAFPSIHTSPTTPSSPSTPTSPSGPSGEDQPEWDSLELGQVGPPH